MISIFGKEWANETLRWFLRDILYADTWVLPHNRKFKVILANVLIERLESYGFGWQADRMRNHVYRWMRMQKVVYAEGDTLSDRERREHSNVR